MPKTPGYRQFTTNGFNRPHHPQSVDIIDKLSYFYAPQSNTLMKVNDPAYHEGFKNGANGGDDYAYDLNGNLIKDLNKQIVEISYNHLNLPESIEFVSPPNVERDRIAYIYSAEGVKLQKLVITNNSATIVSTDYAGNYIYEDGVLKMFFHPEGYVEPVDPNDYSQGFRYAYQYKDHLGNIRLSYTKDQQNSIFYKDGFENGPQGWSAPQNGLISAGGGALFVSLSSNGDNTHKSFSITPNKPVHIEFDLIPGIVNYISGNTKVYFSEYVNGAWETYANSDSFALNPGLFEKTLSFGSNQIKVSLVRTANTGTVNFSMSYFILKQNALQIIDEKNYYPFGMEHQGYNSSVTGAENNYQTYQGKEIEKELGLGWHDFGARRFMADIGRWTTIDPLAELMYSYSPYSHSFNNPVYFLDPTGMSPIGLGMDINYSDYYRDGLGNVIFDRRVNGPKDVPEGGTYIGETYTDPVSGTFWDKNGKPHNTTQQLSEVVVTADAKSPEKPGGGIAVYSNGTEDRGREGHADMSIDTNDLPGIPGRSSASGGSFSALLEELANFMRWVVGAEETAEELAPNESTMENKTGEEAEKTPEEIKVLVKKTTIFRVHPPYGQQGLRIHSSTKDTLVYRRDSLRTVTESRRKFKREKDSIIQIYER